MVQPFAPVLCLRRLIQLPSFRGARAKSALTARAREDGRLRPYVLRRAMRASSESIITVGGYGFRARGLKPAPRNDGRRVETFVRGTTLAAHAEADPAARAGAALARPVAARDPQQWPNRHRPGGGDYRHGDDGRPERSADDHEARAGIDDDRRRPPDSGPTWGPACSRHRRPLPREVSNIFFTITSDSRACLQSRRACEHAIAIGAQIGTLAMPHRQWRWWWWW